MSCSLEEKPQVGGLVILVDSDLAVPKDLDQLQLTVTQGNDTLLSADQRLSAAFPREFRLQSTTAHVSVTVRAVGLKDGVVRIERNAIASIPANYVGVVRLPLNYLCLGTATPTGESTCRRNQTCKQGSCASATINTDLPDYDKQLATGTLKQNTTAGARDAGAASCFALSQCLGEATEMVPDPSPDGLSCFFSLPPLFDDKLNVALRLPPESPGFCDAGGCWVAFDSGTEGFLFIDGKVVLPPGVCKRRANDPGVRIAVSYLCAAKTPDLPLCTPGSEAPGAPRAGSGSAPVAPIATEPIPKVGDACSGAAARACGMCGTSTRTCQNGLWSLWSPCAGEGLCAPNAAQSCGSGGVSICGGDCKWGPCDQQSCTGPVSQTCGNCGTQYRVCNNGAWSTWSACEKQGLCAPNATASCGSGGTQTCGGNCQWGACTAQVCPGAAAEQCGPQCGTKTRTCDPTTATWSDWGECTSDGVCEPGQTRACGSNGTQSCGGDCQWDDNCRGQTCSGPTTQQCGQRCGTQSRRCDPSTGRYGAWGPCNEGDCIPNETRGCGEGGTQVCGGNCRWDGACTGQQCTGQSTRNCGLCGLGRQMRTCDTASGGWQDWGTCVEAPDACMPNGTRTCGNGGTQTCGTDCAWSACSGQTCPGAPAAATRPCGPCNSGTQTQTCDDSTGTWRGDWTECTGGTGCTPDSKDPSCGAGTERVCGSNCQWATETCVPLPSAGSGGAGEAGAGTGAGGAGSGGAAPGGGTSEEQTGGAGMEAAAGSGDGPGTQPPAP